MDEQDLYEGQGGQDAGGIQAPPPASAAATKAKRAPQKTVDQFWDIFTTKYPGKVSSILPENVYAKSKAANEPKGVVRGRAAFKSYEETKSDCIAAVEKIAKECRRVNMRYRDPHFDIEFDLKWDKKDCLEGLVTYSSESPLTPSSVKRVPVSNSLAIEFFITHIDLCSSSLRTRSSRLMTLLLAMSVRAVTVTAGFCLLFVPSPTRLASSTKSVLPEMRKLVFTASSFIEVWVRQVSKFPY